MSTYLMLILPLMKLLNKQIIRKAYINDGSTDVIYEFDFCLKNTLIYSCMLINTGIYISQQHANYELSS